MARSARSFLARLLPWAALVVMTVFFFAQVRARQRAEADARRAREAAERPAAEPPAAAGKDTSVAAAPDELVMLRSAIATRTSELDRARMELEALRSERDSLHAQIERAAAARAAQAERAGALAGERDEWKKVAQERVTALQEELRKAEAVLARRSSKVKGWVESVAGDDEEARARALADAKSADASQKAELRGLWLSGADDAYLQAFAQVVASWKPGPIASDLAGRLIAAAPEDVDLAELLRLLEPHVRRIEGMAFILRSPSTRVLRAALPWLDPGTVAWSDDARAALGKLLCARLVNQDAALLKVVAGGLGRVGTAEQADALVELLTHADAGVRLTAAWALTRILGAERALPVVGKTVAALLGETTAEVRARAIHLARTLLAEAQPVAPTADLDAEAGRLRDRLAAMADG